MTDRPDHLPSARKVDPYGIIASFARLVDPEQAYQEVLRLVTEWFEADCGQIIAVDLETGEPMERAVSSGLRGEERTFSRTILSDAMQRNRALCIPDAKTHPSYRTAASVHDIEGPYLSVVVVPMRDEEGHSVGALYLQRWSGRKGFYREDEEVLQLENLLGRLTPILRAQQQRFFFNGLRLTRIKKAIADMGFIIGPAQCMNALVYDRIEKFAQSDHTVCILGETGTGKELVAQAIHKLSLRAEKPFFRIPCNAISADLAESEFFGHVKGAFAQAYHDKPSPFELANGGTLFLDEIGELPLAVQSKLLHMLEKGLAEKIRFYRVGGVKEISADVRILAASNRSLRDLLARGQLRSDLFYRLNQLPLHVPPLRERRDDIIPLATGFLEQHNRKLHKQLRLAPDTYQALLDYPWPGNVRELKNAIDLAATLHEGAGALAPEEIINQAMREGVAAAAGASTAAARVPFRELSKQQKVEVVRETVSRLGSARKAAQELGISHQTVYAYLEIEGPRAEPPA